MATIPYLIVSPNTIISILGLIHGPDKTVPTPVEDWREAKVDVVIPAFNEERNIPLCLASIAKQTLRPRRIILIDDGSHDKTSEYAKAFCELNEMEILIIKRKAPIGKTPTVKRQAREFDSDVEFILDGDTILESENYIERTVQELYQGVGIACACGTILPLRNRDRKALLDTPFVKKFSAANPDAPIHPKSISWLRRSQRSLTNLYRDILYTFLQRFVYLGQMVFFGSILSPVGCAVAYRRKYVKDLFDKYEPVLGDNFTNSEDIFIGFALVNQGYRNIQLTDVYARSEEPEARALPKQLYMWSSSFLQSCFYFDALLHSPFKAFKRYRQRRLAKKMKVDEMRHIKEAYRQAFGTDYTKKYGRPLGWVFFTSAIEKIYFPTALLIMMLLCSWKAVGMTLLVETVLALTILTIIAKGQRLEYLLKGVIMSPIRYLPVLFDLATIALFFLHVRVFNNRNWHK
ncbi:MAG: glycosyltransferase family 2 protein [Candidatus Aminicenantes bacterium]|nr:MAG: glycosyltransferase family 2 protein [Candidatus Aminicenantes bacterium]